MKKTLLTIGLGCLLSLSASAADLVFATNILQAAGDPAFILRTNRSVLKSVTLLSTESGTINFYDSATIAAPYKGTNAVTSAYTNVVTYSTNIVSTYIGANGVTNTITNSGIFSLMVSNAAATNELPKRLSFAFQPNLSVTYPITESALFVNGVSVRPSTNVSVIFYYNTGGL